MIHRFDPKDYFAMMFNHSLDLVVRLIEIVRAICL